jgi:hypothetical protein
VPPAAVVDIIIIIIIINEHWSRNYALNGTNR